MPDNLSKTLRTSHDLTTKVYSNSQKEQIFKEHLEHGLSISTVSRKYQINAVTLYAWKKMLMGSNKSGRREG
jgi:transposase-like protein